MPPPTSRFPWLLAVLASGLAGLFLLQATRSGLLMDDDSFSYLESSKNIAAGHGYVFAIPPDPVAPVTHFPPLHPAGLAVLLTLIHDDRQAARWWNILCLGIEVGLFFWIVWTVTDGQRWLALCGALLFGLHPHVLESHAGVLSEPLFLVLLLGSLATLLRFSASPHTGWLIAASLLAGLAGLARYSGLIHVVLIPLVFVLIAIGSWRRRLILGLISAAFVALPIAAWSLRNVVDSGSATDRSLHYHLIGAAHLQEAALTLSAWLLPWRFVNLGTGLLIALLLAATLIVLAIAFMADGHPSEPRSPLTAFACFAVLYLVGYLGHLVAAISLLHYNTPLDARLLLPALTLFLLAVAILPSLIPCRFSPVWIAILCLGLLGLNAVRARAWANDPRRPDRGFYGREWTQIPAVAFLRTLPPETEIWTNARGPLYAQLRRPIRLIPPERNWSTTELIPHATTALRQISDSAQKQRTVVAFLPPNRPTVDFSVDGSAPAGLGRFQDFSLSELQAHLPLHRIFAEGPMEVFQVGDQPVSERP